MDPVLIQSITLFLVPILSIFCITFVIVFLSTTLFPRKVLYQQKDTTWDRVSSTTLHNKQELSTTNNNNSTSPDLLFKTLLLPNYRLEFKIHFHGKEEKEVTIKEEDEKEMLLIGDMIERKWYEEVLSEGEESGRDVAPSLPLVVDEDEEEDSDSCVEWSEEEDEDEILSCNNKPSRWSDVNTYVAVASVGVAIASAAVKSKATRKKWKWF